MRGAIPTVRALADSDVQQFITGKKTAFPGVGPDTLIRLRERAVLLTTKGAKPVLRSPVRFPPHEMELFFDIEVDPMRDICYLHGFVERRRQDNATEKFVAFFAEEPTPEGEKKAFADAWSYLKRSRPCSIYYYSKYERTIYRKLQEKYGDVCTSDEIEELFDPGHAIDLYNDVVKKATEWPTRDYSIKTLAKFLGFPGGIRTLQVPPRLSGLSGSAEHSAVDLDHRAGRGGRGSDDRKDDRINDRINDRNRDPADPAPKERLNQRQRWYLEALAAGKEVRAGDLRRRWGVSEKTARRDVGALKDCGMIEFVGPPKTGRYRLRR